jgi:hypothetical protein
MMRSTTGHKGAARRQGVRLMDGWEADDVGIPRTVPRPKGSRRPAFHGPTSALALNEKSLVAIWRIPAAEALMTEGTMDKAKGGRTSAPPFAP